MNGIRSMDIMKNSIVKGGIKQVPFMFIDYVFVEDNNNFLVVIVKNRKVKE